jgi:mono/diheme cytochrome c family protein
MSQSIGLVFGLALLFSAAAAAQDLPGDPGRGHAIAEHGCSACHAIDPGVRAPPGVAAPTFQDVADDPAMTELALNAFFQTPHQNMPNLQLSAENMADLIAYILSLKQHPTSG